MLAGCSSTLLSPRHRLRSEASAQFQACHYPLPSMSTQRLDLPCNFPRKEVSRQQSIRAPVGLSVEKPLETKTLKQSIRVPPSPEGRREIKTEFWREKGKNLKRRLTDQGSFDDDDDDVGRAKRKKNSYDFGDSDGYSPKSKDFLNLNHLGSEGRSWKKKKNSYDFGDSDGYSPKSKDFLNLNHLGSEGRSWKKKMMMN